jgi:hypothetical protein
VQIQNVVSAREAAVCSYKRKVYFADRYLESFSLREIRHDVPLNRRRFESPCKPKGLTPFGRKQRSEFCAISIRATGKVCLMLTEKKIIEFADCTVTVIVRHKRPPKSVNDNEKYDFWSDELKELFDRYDK